MRITGLVYNVYCKGWTMYSVYRGRLYMVAFKKGKYTVSVYKGSLDILTSPNRAAAYKSIQVTH